MAAAFSIHLLVIINYRKDEVQIIDVNSHLAMQ